MADAENNQSQVWKNLPLLVDMFNFVGLTSASSALIVAYARNFSTLFNLFAPIHLLIYLITIFNNLRCIFFLEIFFLIFMSSTYYTLNLSNLVLLGWILLIVGFTCFSFIALLFLRSWQSGGSVDLSGISAQIQMMSFELLIVLIVNGYTMLFEWCIHQERRVWNVLGVGLITLLVFASVVSCVFRMVYRWRKYHRAGVRVSPVNSTAEAVPAQDEAVAGQDVG